jgi:hypothetical protein
MADYFVATNNASADSAAAPSAAPAATGGDAAMEDDIL